MEPIILKSHVVLYRDQFEITEGHQPQNALIIVDKGSFSCSFTNEKEIIAKADDLIFFPIINRFRRHVIEPLQCQLLYFSLHEENPLSMKIPHGLIRLDNKERAQSNIDMLRKLRKRKDAFAVMMKQHVLNDIFLQYYLQNEKMADSEDSLSPQVKMVIQYVEKNLKESFTLEKLARCASCSESTLIRHFKKDTGQAPFEYIIQRKMTAAKHLLSLSDQSIGNIAAECGYENIYYFSNSFRKHLGCSPTEYRKKSKLFL
ncbi:MAG TPA: AraC family transcriptional regulator [Sphaerochaeta sp.]|jgi:AraC-like DNA-binding protein|nr:AraC family transcriptional regulator [Sphaerochaeta sp.]HQB05189.1 AraC family transcriptional regulator [Sphaerochaeta sp.]